MIVQTKIEYVITTWVEVDHPTTKGYWNYVTGLNQWSPGSGYIHMALRFSSIEEAQFHIEDNNLSNKNYVVGVQKVTTTVELDETLL